MEGGRTTKFRRGCCASKQRWLNVGKLNKGGKREFFAKLNRSNVLFDNKRNMVIIANNKPTIL